MQQAIVVGLGKREHHFLMCARSFSFSAQAFSDFGCPGLNWDNVDYYAETATQPAMVVGSGMESPSSRIDSK